MPRPMSPQREREYEELHGFLDFIATHVSEIDLANPFHPTNVGKQIIALYGKSKALDGLKQAVNDTVEMFERHPLEYVCRLDVALRERGLATLSEIRRRYASTYRRILKRGNIKTETEYYLVAGVLADLAANVTKDERAQLEILSASYSGRDA